MKRGKYLLAVVAIIATMAQLVLQPCRADEKPLNVLFVAVDELRPEIGAYCTPPVKKPHMDHMAESGLRFDCAYVHQTVF